MRKPLILPVVLLLFAGCAGTNSIKVSTVPEGARLYANGEYLGLTPRSVPSNWWHGGGDNVQVRLEKDGYRTVEKAIPWSELNHRYWQGDLVGGSEFGLGNTFPYTIHLEPLASPAEEAADPAPYRSVEDVPVTAYVYDHETGKGTISVDISGKGIEVRHWIVENIGKICSSKNILLEAGRESPAGGRYRVLNESVADGILTIEFEAAF